jgi:hypothetical protein
MNVVFCVVQYLNWREERKETEIKIRDFSFSTRREDGGANALVPWCLVRKAAICRLEIPWRREKIKDNDP